MKYILLIHEPAGAPADPEMFPKHQAFAEAAGRRGKLVDGAALAGVEMTTTIRHSGGETMVTDGPHAETKEHLGGYYVIDCADLDEAIELAGDVPLRQGGSVEIRPLVGA